ncbi:hypothetical protein ACIQXU_11390 [Peribacillus sp. NPDC097284]|uniref:hypothetical protein n=1 Tax=Peribacillus sp. NPDC097284 TaxID=3364401 RepID=UPI00381FB5B9
MKHHGFYPLPQQNGNHQFQELDIEAKLPQTQSIEGRILELERQNERQQLKRISQVHHDVSRINAAVDHVNQIVNRLTENNQQRKNNITKHPWDDEIIPFNYTVGD